MTPAGEPKTTRPRRPRSRLFPRSENRQLSRARCMWHNMGAAKRPASSPGEPAWPRSRLPGSSPCSGELFPLPRIPSLGIDCTGSRSSRRRAARRDEVLEASNGAVDALNHLYGMTARSDGPMTAAHQSVHHRILARVADIKPNFFLTLERLSKSF